MHYVVFDIEYHNSANSNYKVPHEIIDIGAVKIDENFQIVSTFSRLVKPTLEPRLTGFIRKFTKIKQENIDLAPNFKEVISDFIEWLGDDYLLCTWGADDSSFFRKECVRHDVSQKWITPSYDIQRVFSCNRGRSKHQVFGLKNALKALEIEKDVPFHHAINDALYTAMIFIQTSDEHCKKSTNVA